MKKISIVLFVIFLFFLAFTLIKIKTKKEGTLPSKINLVSPPLNSSEIKADYSLGVFITLEAKDGKVTVLMENDRILVEPFEKTDDSSKAESFTVTEEEYPELFQRNGGVHFLSAEINNDRLRLINNVHDHGGWSPYYKLNVDLYSGQVLSQNYEY